MQAVNETSSNPIETPVTLRIPAEFVAYALLIAVTLLLRFAYLGSVPMTETEAIQALPAYHALHAEAPGTPEIASSPLVFWLQWISFTLFGGTELAARLPGVLGGLLLTLSPLLFRDRFGREITFVWSLALAFSPVAFTAARLTDPAIFAAFFALLTVWAFLRHAETRATADALLSAGFAAALLFLTGVSGLLLGLMLLASAALTTFWQISNAPDERDTPGDDLLREIQTWLRSLPALQMLGAGAIVVLAGATGFMSYPLGMAIIGESLSDFLRGFFQPAVDGAPGFYAPVALLVYEWALLILGGIASLLLVFANYRSLAHRFALSWALIAFVVILLYRGATPADALWVMLPLTFIVASFVAAALDNHMPSLLSLNAYYSDDPNAYSWIKWMLAIVVLAAGTMLSLNFAELGRATLDYPGTALTFNTEQHNVMFYGRIGWFLIMAMVVIVGYFLTSSIYGNRTAAQGFGLGAFLFALMIGAGIGWNTAVEQVTNPREWWYPSAVQPDATTLRETLFEVATRDTRRFPDIPISILRDPEAGITGSGLVAWLVRDFQNAEFVESLAATRQQQIILLPHSDDVTEPELDLGGSYVGQSFTLREHWTPQNMIALDWASWLAQRRTRPYQLPQDTAVLWLRIDVFSGETPATPPRR